MEARLRLHLVSGEYQGTQGPIDSLTNLFTATLDLQAGGRFQDELPEGAQVLFYVGKWQGDPLMVRLLKLINWCS